ncbi:hypothetical protein [Candidatus Pantoea formicae]|uniref:hypothetical protein n=1 Tax=Candidatus Pantoea formicae TaxID=2608355 RepID=UPI003ED9E7A9
MSVNLMRVLTEQELAFVSGAGNYADKHGPANKVNGVSGNKSSGIDQVNNIINRDRAGFQNCATSVLGGIIGGSLGSKLAAIGSGVGGGIGECFSNGPANSNGCNTGGGNRGSIGGQCNW